MFVFSISEFNMLLSKQGRWGPQKVERWQGPPHINKVKQFDTVLSFRVRLFIQFIQSWKQRVLVYLICLGLGKPVNKRT